MTLIDVLLLAALSITFALVVAIVFVAERRGGREAEDDYLNDPALGSPEAWPFI